MPSAPTPGRTPPASTERRRRPSAPTPPGPSPLEAARRSLLARAFCYDDPASYTAGVEAAFAAIGTESQGRSA